MNKIFRGYKTELLLIDIFEKLGYKVIREDNNVVSYDMLLEKDNEKFVVEIKVGKIGTSYFENILEYNPYTDLLEAGYKVVLICEKDKINKRLLNKLETEGIIVWDLDIIKNTQKDIYKFPENK